MLHLTDYDRSLLAGERPPSAPPSVDDVRQIAAVGDPVVRNLQITQAYHDLSAAMVRLTGAGANWCTVATWASKQAGQSIRREDLLHALERLLLETPAAQVHTQAMLEASTPIRGAVSGPQPESFSSALGTLWNAVDPAAAFQRTSDAVARGNVKVFSEIGTEFARFLAMFEASRSTAARPVLDAFGERLQPGDPPDGQRYLAQAFDHYVQAINAEDSGQKAQLLLLANLEIGFHEQTRLQEEIVEAMNAPVIHPRVLRRRLISELFPDRSSRLRYWLARPARRLGPLLQARDQLAEEVQRVGRRVITATLMALALPTGEVLQLGQELPDRYPDVLKTVDHPELSAFLGQILAGSDRTARVTDWGDLDQRMRFIANLFRIYHLAPALFDPPFDAEQVTMIRAGKRPEGRL